MSNTKIFEYQDYQAVCDIFTKLHVTHDEQLRSEFMRSLPFQDGMFDRWERAKRLGFGERTSIYNSSCVFGNVTVGCDTWIGPYTLLDGIGGELIIGDHCAISTGVHIYTHDTILRTLSGGKHPVHHASVKIGNCCHLAPQVIIAAGVQLGNHCLVAVNSYVNKSFGDNMIVGGSPAKQIGEIKIQSDDSIKLIYDKYE